MKNKIGVELKETLKGSGIAFLLKVMGVFTMFGVTLYITNTFGAEIYGNYVLFFTSIKLLSVLAVFGIDLLVVKNVAKWKSENDWPKIKENLRLAYVSIFVLGGSMSTTLLLCRNWIASFFEVSVEFVIFLSISILPYSLIKIQNQCFRGEKKIAIYSFFEYVMIHLCLGLFLFLIKNLSSFGQTHLLLYAQFISIIFICLLSFYLWNKTLLKNGQRLIEGQQKIKLKAVFEFLSKSSPYLFATSFTIFSTWIIHFFLKHYGSAEDIGVYDVVFKVALLCTIPLMAINSIMAPKISESINNYERLKKISRQATLLSIICAFPLCLFLFLFPYLIIPFFGDSFVYGTTAFRIILVGQLINASTGPVGLLLQMSGNEKIFKNIVIVCSLASITICLITIPRLGLIGGALGYLTFVSIGAMLSVYWVHKKLKILTIKYL